MVAKKMLVRVVNCRYVRVVGAKPQDISCAFSYIKTKWAKKEVALVLSTHTEHWDWYHITFDIGWMNSKKIKERATLIRDDLKRFFLDHA